MKLQVLLRDLGLGSRRKAEELIGAGRVEVNGRIAHIGQIVTGEETIRVDGHTVKGKPSENKYYLLVHKPRGYTSTTADFYDNEQSVLELLPYELRKLTQWQIVGRLDKDSEGLMLLTNDGHVSYVLTHPKFQVQKEYQVTVARPLTSSELQKLKDGVTSETGETYRFKQIRVSVKSTVEYVITLTEGKKREIREALGVIGSHVQRLVRTKIGELELGNLSEGENRMLTEQEVFALQAFVQRVSDSHAKQIKP